MLRSRLKVKVWRDLPKKTKRSSQGKKDEVVDIGRGIITEKPVKDEKHKSKTSVVKHAFKR